MNESFFNFLDYMYILLMLLSSLAGFVRGVTKEILSLLSWIGAGFVAIILAPFFSPLIHQYIENSKISHELSIGLAYILTLIVMLITSSLISQSVKSSSLSNVDRSLGVIFGLLRSIFLLLMVAIIILLFNVKTQKYNLLKESQLTKFTCSIAKDLMPTLEKTEAISNIMKKNRKNGSPPNSQQIKLSEQNAISKISPPKSSSAKIIKHLHKSGSVLQSFKDIRIGS